MKLENDTFYLRDSRSNLGTKVNFWRDSGSYTTNVDEAEVFTRKDAFAQHDCRESDEPLSKAATDKCLETVVDMQHLPDSPIVSKDNVSEIVVLHRKYKYDGNDIYFVTGTRKENPVLSTDFKKAKEFTIVEALNFIMKSRFEFHIHLKKDIEKITRQAFPVRKLNAVRV